MSQFSLTSLPAVPKESCPWPRALGLGRLCRVDYGQSVALKGFCAAREAGEGSAAKRKRGENLPGAAPAVEVFSRALYWGLGMLVPVRVGLAPLHPLPLASGS